MAQVWLHLKIFALMRLNLNVVAFTFRPLNMNDRRYNIQINVLQLNVWHFECVHDPLVFILNQIPRIWASKVNLGITIYLKLILDCTSLIRWELSSTYLYESCCSHDSRARSGHWMWMTGITTFRYMSPVLNEGHSKCAVLWQFSYNQNPWIWATWTITYLRPI